MKTCKRQEAGFTLVELIVTIIIAGIILLILFIGFHEALKHIAFQRDIRRAVALSEDLMNEARSSRYIGDPAVFISTRADCVWIDDYDGWSESPPETVEGEAIPGFEGFTRRVVVEHVGTNDFNFNGPAATNYTEFKRITVIVSNANISVSNVSVVGRY